MRPCLALLSFLALPALAQTPAPVTRVEVFASHESGASVREERLTAVDGKGGLELRLKITVGGKVEESAPVEIPREAWLGLLETVAVYGLQEWDLGDEGPAGLLLTLLSWAGKYEMRGVELEGHEGMELAIVIDFAVVTPRTQVITRDVCYTNLAIREVSKDEVELTAVGYVKKVAKSPVVYRVPRSEGRKRFDHTATGLDLTSLEAFRQK